MHPRGLGGKHGTHCVSFSSSFAMSGRAGSGFKLNVENIESLALNLGPHTTSPLTSVGVSLNYGPYVTLNVSEGSNIVPLGGASSMQESFSGKNTVVRITTEGWQDNRMQLESLVVNQASHSLDFLP